MYNAGLYHVDITVDRDYIPAYADRFFECGDDYEGRTSRTNCYRLSVFNATTILSNVTIGADGGGTGVSPTSFILTEDRLVICCGDSIFCMEIPTLNLTWCKQLDDATCFQVLAYEDDYIIHGELAISRIDKDGNVKWSKTGRDIISDMSIAYDCIEVEEYDGKRYRFDFNGNEC